MYCLRVRVTILHLVFICSILCILTIIVLYLL